MLNANSGSISSVNHVHPTLNSSSSISFDPTSSLSMLAMSPGGSIDMVPGTFSKPGSISGPGSNIIGPVPTTSNDNTNKGKRHSAGSLRKQLSTVKDDLDQDTDSEEEIEGKVKVNRLESTSMKKQGSNGLRAAQSGKIFD